MPRRRRQEPDNRLDWRDPRMPVLRRPWVEVLGTFERREQMMTPEQSSELATESFRESDGPDWRNDPTYNLRRRRR